MKICNGISTVVKFVLLLLTMILLNSQMITSMSTNGDIFGSSGCINLSKRRRSLENSMDYDICPKSLIQMASSSSSIQINPSSATSTVLVSSVTTTTPTTESTTATTSTTSAKSNPISQIAGFFKDNIIRLKNGTVQLYTNHKVCNTIRSKQKEYIAANPKPTDAVYQKTGITFEEYKFLNQGKDDRGKVLNLVFMAFFSPNFLPTAFFFFPNVLPSQFSPKPPTQCNKYETISRERAHAVIQTLLEIEKEAKNIPTSINPFGISKLWKNRERMEVVNQRAQQFLCISHNYTDGNQHKNDITTTTPASSSSFVNEERILKALSNDIFTNEKPDRSRTRLTFIPKALIKGLAQAIDANIITAKGTSGTQKGPLSSLTPPFMVRNKVLTHLKMVTDADEFLVNERIDLNSLSGDILMDVCNERMIGTPGTSEADLRTALSKWLNLTVVRPSHNRLLSSLSSISISGESTVTNMGINHNYVASNDKLVVEAAAAPADNKGRDERAPITTAFASTTSTVGGNTKESFYNSNLAKFVLLCYNAVDGTRDTRSASALPRSLYD